MRHVHVVHDGSGRILAVADAADTAGPNGLILRHAPRPRPGQHLVQMELGDEHGDLHALALVRDYELDLDASPLRLRPRGGGSAS